MKRILLAALPLAFFAIHSLGAGFSLNEGSARGVADFPVAVAAGGRAGDQYYNPAVLSSITGTVVEVGSFVIKPHISIVTENPYTGLSEHHAMKKEWWNVPHAHIATPLSENWTFGLGLFSRAGLGGELGEEWAGRYNNTGEEILSYACNPNLVWKVSDRLSLSAGLTLLYFDITLKQHLDVLGQLGIGNPNDPARDPASDIAQRLDADDWAGGADFGLQFRPLDALNIGLAYHSRIHVEARGGAKYRVPAAVAAIPQLDGYFHDARMSGVVNLPASCMMGVTYDVTDRLTIGAGAVWTEWSSWDRLHINIHEPHVLPGRDFMESEKRWKDVWRYTGSISYRFTDELTGHVSYTWDESPINGDHVDYLVPADDRHMWCFGLAWEHGPWTVDATYFVEHIHHMDITGRPADGVFSGKFCAGSARAVALTVGHTF